MKTKSLLGLICFFSLVACSPKNPTTTQLPPTESVDYLASFLDTSIDSGDYGVVTTSTTKIFSFKNVGDSSGPATPTITGTNATAFSIILQTGCGTVNVNSSCTVRVNFNPSGKSSSTYNAILSVGGTTKALSAIVGSGSTSGGGSGTIEATISDVIIDNPLDFGTFSGTQTSTKTIKLTNKGTSSVGPLSAALSDTDFSFLINSCVGKTLAPNAFCSVRVSFNATGKMAQEYLTDLTFGTSSFPLKATVSSGGSTTTGGTTGGGASNLTILEGLSPITTPVDYGTLTGSQSLIKIFTIKNAGTSNIIVNPTLNNTNFTMILNSCSNKNLLPNGSCSIRVGFAAKNKIDQEYLSTITVVTGSTIELKATVSGSQGGGIIYTYDPVFSSWGTCSADQACEGVGSQTRTITQCNRFQDGNPAGVGTLADCASFNIPLNTTQSCGSPQGNVTLPILGGEQVFSCPVGSTVQTFESVSCNSGYHINGQVCEADPNMYSLTIQNGTSATITDGSNVFCDGTCPSQTVSYQENTLVNLQVTYPSNYRFLGWTGACSGTSSICSLTMTTNLTVGVNLELISPPSGLTLTINNGDSYTNSLGVSLMLSATDAEEMKVSDGTGCANGTWEPFSETKNYILNSLNALVDISFMTRNAGGESECVSSSITHDDISPEIVFDQNTNQITSTGNYTFNYMLNDMNISYNVDIEEYEQTACSGSFVTHNLVGSSLSVNLTTGQTKSIKVKSTDLAGNYQEACSYDVTYQSAPTLSISLNNCNSSVSLGENYSCQLQVNESPADNYVFDSSHTCGSWLSINSSGLMLGIPQSGDVGECVLSVKALKGTNESLAYSYKIRVQNIIYPLKNLPGVVYEQGSLKTFDKTEYAFNLLIFKAYHPSYGTELWVYNPNQSISSTVGAYPAFNPGVLDLNIGAGSSNIGEYITQAGAILFTADDGGTRATSPTRGRELWRWFPGNSIFSGGQNSQPLWICSGNAHPCLLDINPGSGSSNPSNLIGNAGGPTSGGSFSHYKEYYFLANNGTSGNELYRGTWSTSHTTFTGNCVSTKANPCLFDLNSGAGSSDISNLTKHDKQLYFLLNKKTWYRTLLNKTTEFDEIYTVGDIRPTGDALVSNVYSMGEKLFFSADNGSSAQEVFKIDSGTISQVADINPSGSSNPKFFNSLDSNNLVFIANNGSEDRLYSYNKFTNILDSYFLRNSSNFIKEMTSYRGEVFLVGDLDGTKDYLWKVSIPTGNKTLVKSFSTSSGNTTIKNFSKANGILFFFSDLINEGIEIWSSLTGVESDTKLTLDLNSKVSISTGIRENLGINLFSNNKILDFAENLYTEMDTIDYKGPVVMPKPLSNSQECDPLVGADVYAYEFTFNSRGTKSESWGIKTNVPTTYISTWTHAVTGVVTTISNSTYALHHPAMVFTVPASGNYYFSITLTSCSGKSVTPETQIRNIR